MDGGFWRLVGCAAYNWVSRCPLTGSVELQCEFTTGPTVEWGMKGNLSSELQLGQIGIVGGRVSSGGCRLS